MTYPYNESYDNLIMNLSDSNLFLLPPIVSGPNEADFGLDCSMNNLTELPDDWAYLKTLDFSYNNLAVLPKNMPKITNIDIIGNNLEWVPMNVYNYKKLTHLDLSENYIKILVKYWVFPDTLIELNLSNNLLLCIPSNLPDSISILNLSGNKITALPYKLPNNLNKLYLSNNRIQYLTNNLPINLTYLTIDDNELELFPENLPNNLVWFTYDNNPKIENLFPLLKNIFNICKKPQYIAEMNIITRTLNRLIIINRNNVIINYP